MDEKEHLENDRTGRLVTLAQGWSDAGNIDIALLDSLLDHLAIGGADRHDALAALEQAGFSVPHESTRRQVDGYRAFCRRSNHRLLSAKEERQLGAFIQAGKSAQEASTDSGTHRTLHARMDLARDVYEGMVAYEMLVSHNIRLVMFHARKFNPLSPVLDHEDLVDEGFIALSRTAKTWDPRRGVRFATYASPAIYIAMKTAVLTQVSAVRLPVNASEGLNHIHDAQISAAQNSVVPTTAAIAEITGIATDNVARLLVWDEEPSSIDDLRDTYGEDLDLGPAVDDDPNTDAEWTDLAVDLDWVLAHLRPREREVILRRFGIDGTPPQSLAAIAADLGLTRQRICQIQEKALASIRFVVFSNNLFAGVRPLGA